ncbi:MAG TPA: DUF447 domain-containing protein, partial [Methylomirabilota bacterium]|nr:DUF447 domain-containing protein [Methylomirabilota bacterium]
MTPLTLETIVSTLDAEGEPNFAAMGVVWDEARVTIRPFLNTRTYRNLTASGAAVVNVTDNVLTFARSALSRARLPWFPARDVPGAVLEEACHWREVRVERVRLPAGEGAPPRAEVVAAVVGGGQRRPFSGLCRAKHAVVEASIVASRLRFVPLAEALG